MNPSAPQWNGADSALLHSRHRGVSQLYLVPTRKIIRPKSAKSAAVRKDGEMIVVTILIRMNAT